MQNLMPSLAETTEISLYKGELSEDVMREQLKVFRAAFPTLPAMFFVILKNRLIENNFTNERLIDAIKRVIDTCHYPTPTVADIIQYDVKSKLYRHDEVAKIAGEGGSWDDFVSVDIGQDKPKWIAVSDYLKSGLKKWKQN